MTGLSHEHLLDHIHATCPTLHMAIITSF